MAEKTVLITGGCGFIGSHVCRHFVTKYPNYNIINVDGLTYAGIIDNVKDLELYPNYMFEYVDLVLDNHKLTKIFLDHNIDIVIHMAAESHVDRSLDNPSDFVKTNVNGTVNLLNAALNIWGSGFENKIFFNMITDEIFGSLTNEDNPFTEYTPLNPHSPYSTSKTAQYLFGKTYFESYGMPIVSLSCGNAIGPNQYPEKLVPVTIRKLMNGGEIPIYGEGKQKRDWTNVHDICDAIDLIIHKGRVGDLYCIGGDACIENIEIVNKIINKYVTITSANNNLSDLETKELLNKCKSQIRFIKDPRGKAHDFRYDICHDKITNELGWYPKRTIDDSIDEVVSWCISNDCWFRKIESKK